MTDPKSIYYSKCWRKSFWSTDLNCSIRSTNSTYSDLTRESCIDRGKFQQKRTSTDECRKFCFQKFHDDWWFREDGPRSWDRHRWWQSMIACRVRMIIISRQIILLLHFNICGPHERGAEDINGRQYQGREMVVGVSYNDIRQKNCTHVARKRPNRQS